MAAVIGSLWQKALAWVNDMAQTLQLRVVPGRYSVARLDAHADFPGWLKGPGFQAAIRSDDELTVVCLNDRVPGDVQVEKDWVCLRTIGPFAFDATGIVLSLIRPLSDNGIGVFVICTFDGEHMLIPGKDAESAFRHLALAGHRLQGAFA
jgi:uncharacterized protein